MLPIAIRASHMLLPTEPPIHAEFVVFEPNSPTYAPLPAVRLSDGRIITQWEPNQHELDALNRGIPLTLIQHTGGNPQPVQLIAGDLIDLTP